MSQARALHSVSTVHFHLLTLRLGSSTSSCLIPVNFLPNCQHLQHIFWPSNQGPSTFTRTRASQGGSCQLTEYKLLPTPPSPWLMTRMVGCWPSRAHALITALIYPVERRQVSAAKDVTLKVKKGGLFKKEPTDS